MRFPNPAHSNRRVNELFVGHQPNGLAVGADLSRPPPIYRPYTFPYARLPTTISYTPATTEPGAESEEVIQ